MISDIIVKATFRLEHGILVKDVEHFNGVTGWCPASYVEKQAYLFGLMRGSHLTPEQVAEEINREVLCE